MADSPSASGLPSHEHGHPRSAAAQLPDGGIGATQPVDGRATTLRTVATQVLRSAGRHDIVGRAAEAAFFAALALFPAVLTLVAVLRAERPLFNGDAAPRVSADLARLLRVVLTSRGRIAADSADALLRTPNSGLLGLGTVVAIVVLARGMRSIQRSLTIISGTAKRSTAREWVRAVLLATGVLTLGSLLLAAFTLGPLLGHSGQVGAGRGADAHNGALTTVWSWIRWPLSAVVIFALATVVLAQEIPGRRRRWRTSAPGAIATLLGWAAATALLPIYVAFAGTASPALGSLGGGLIVLLWLYLLTMSLYLGAEINAARAARGSAAPTGSSRQ